MCLSTEEMPEASAIGSVEAAGQVYNQTNEFVYLGENFNHNVDLSIEVDPRIRNAWCSFQKYTLELYDRPSAPLKLKIREMLLRAEVLRQCCTVDASRGAQARATTTRCVKSITTSPDSLHRLVNEQSHRQPGFQSGHPHEDGK